ncbi:MAG: hypothetical protein CM1200mP18_06740 [Gammaproteobacteria bacterium]|nr:MAG: hypothetical protein CM1200mP18_06740 [Gammaproteobacteria bacterium]
MELYDTMRTTFAAGDYTGDAYRMRYFIGSSRIPFFAPVEEIDRATGHRGQRKKSKRFLNWCASGQT